MTKWAFRLAKTFDLSLLTFHLFLRLSLHSLNYSCTQRTGKPYARSLLDIGSVSELVKCKFAPKTLDAVRGELLQV